MFSFLNQKKIIEIDKSNNDFYSEIDRFLHKQLKIMSFQKNWDFLHGATGVIFYFIQRAKEDPRNDFLHEVICAYIDSLIQSKISEDDDSIKWEFVDHAEINGTKKIVNISLSHGMSAISLILLKIYMLHGFQKVELVQDLLIKTLNYIAKQQINHKKYQSFFPSYSLESSSELSRSRLGWCYGDLGIAMSLWQAGVALQNEAWKTKALEVFLFAAEKRRDLKANYVIDAGLCHGAAGIGHIFYRMWWNTRMPEFKDAADYWMNETLKMAKFEDGLAGYKTWYGEKKGWVNTYGLLEGIAGIGLALMTYYYETEPAWDECLLLS